MIPHDLAPRLALPPSYNYVGIFLTFACTQNCSYCLNAQTGEQRPQAPLLPAALLIPAINRLDLPANLPVTLQGGEPALHPEFFDIISGIRPALNIDLLTNLDLDIDMFMQRIPPNRLKRTAPYASIRVSYHPENVAEEALFTRVLRLQSAGYSIGIWGILHPRYTRQVLAAQQRAAQLGIDFRTKEFLGQDNGVWYGTYFPPDSVHSPRRSCECRASELLVAPDANVYRCHRDLYSRTCAIGNLCDPLFTVRDIFRPCREYGSCHPCDVKVKTDRFQQHGHTSVAIRLAPGRS